MLSSLTNQWADGCLYFLSLKPGSDSFGTIEINNITLSSTVLTPCSITVSIVKTLQDCYQRLINVYRSMATASLSGPSITSSA